MTRKLSVIIALVLLTSIFLKIPVSAAKPYYADAFDVQIELQEGGSAIFTETVEFQFGGDLSTSIFREISATNTDGIIFLDASMDGALLPRGTQPGQVEVEAGDQLKVTWHFLPTADTAHIFALRYRVEGVVRKGEADTLIWRIFPEDRDYPIVHSTIVLDYPSEPPLVEQPASGRKLDVLWEDDRLILTASKFAENQDLILIARFVPDSLIEVAPRWQIQKEAASAAVARTLPVGFITGIATLMLGSLGLFMYSRARKNNGQENSSAERGYII